MPDHLQHIGDLDHQRHLTPLAPAVSLSRIRLISSPGKRRDAPVGGQGQGQAIVVQELDPAAVDLQDLQGAGQRIIQDLFQADGLADGRGDHVEGRQVLVAALDLCFGPAALGDFRLQSLVGAQQLGGALLDAVSSSSCALRNASSARLRSVMSSEMPRRYCGLPSLSRIGTLSV